MTNDDWNSLLDNIEWGKCTPFIGAGACHPPLPLAEGLAEGLLRRWGGHCPLSSEDQKDLSNVAQFLTIRMGVGWPQTRIAELIRSAYDARQHGFDDDPTEPHRVLADLPLPLYLTTNYDNLMIQALKRKKPKAKQSFARWTGKLLKEEKSEFDKKEYLPTIDEPMVFHLHGHIQEEEGKRAYEALVATEDNYLDFLVKAAVELGTKCQGRLILPMQVRNALTTTTLLFLGYGLKDVNLRVILRWLVAPLTPSEKRTSVAVQFDGPGQNLRDYLEEYFHSDMPWKVFWGTTREFLAELDRRRSTRQTHGTRVRLGISGIGK
jgi:hypothetical protein